MTENWLMFQSFLLFYLFNIYLFFLLSGYTSSAPACFSDAWWLRILWWRHLPALQQTHWLLLHLGNDKKDKVSVQCSSTSALHWCPRKLWGSDGLQILLTFKQGGQDFIYSEWHLSWMRGPSWDDELYIEDRSYCSPPSQDREMYELWKKFEAPQQSSYCTWQ